MNVGIHVHSVGEEPVVVRRVFSRPGETRPEMSVAIGGEVVATVTLFFDTPEQLMGWAALIASKCRQAAAETPRNVRTDAA